MRCDIRFGGAGLCLWCMSKVLCWSYRVLVSCHWAVCLGTVFEQCSEQCSVNAHFSRYCVVCVPGV